MSDVAKSRGGERAEHSFPRITVITPSLNQGRFLEQAIKSVLDQSYSNLEYIVVDGLSTDETPSLLEKYRASLASCIQESDEGQSDAINKGISRATGELVGWLNADDFLLSGALRELAQAFTADPDASFYFGDGVRTDEQGKEKTEFFPGGRVAFRRSALIWGLNFILQPAAFVNRRVAGSELALDKSLNWGMDSDLWLRLSKIADPQPIQSRLAASREYDSTKTRSASFERVEELRQIAQRHSGSEITPGVLCYFLDTLRRECLRSPEVFPTKYINELEKFWSSSARLMKRFGANAEGFPGS